jgi:hypothetical protein
MALASMTVLPDRDTKYTDKVQIGFLLSKENNFVLEPLDKYEACFVLSFYRIKAELGLCWVSRVGSRHDQMISRFARVESWWGAGSRNLAESE